MHGSTRKLFGIIVIIIFLCAIAATTLYWATAAPAPASGYSARVDNAQSTQVAFSCSGGKSIQAVFMAATTTATEGNMVQLSLSDGRQLTLTQVASGDGSRYANKSGSFAFWTKGSEAYVQENGQETYRNCAVAAQ